MNYKSLTINDVRMINDEWRVSEQGPEGDAFSPHHSVPRRGPGEWRKCSAMLGARILASDLCHLEFRRPV